MRQADSNAPPHPYQTVGAEGFWSNVVAAASGEDFTRLFRPKFALTPQDRIATAGSCFAQHIGRALRAANCPVIDAEPAPAGLTPDQAARFGYGLYSGRYGNIYTPRQLLDLLTEPQSGRTPIAWQNGGRWFDALRPNIEPEGLDSAEEVAFHRAAHLECLNQMLSGATVFIFTLGMTEAWQDTRTGTIFPVCPGVIAGEYSADTTRFVNFRYPEILDDLQAIRAALQHFNPAIRLLLTVSPVPLTATASGQHVLAASTYSKATLRAAAQDFAAAHADVDYFPSYEIITSPAARSAWFEANLRQVRPQAVDRVMQIFLAAYGLAIAPSPVAHGEAASEATDSYGIICEDQLLQAFAR